MWYLFRLVSDLKKFSGISFVTYICRYHGGISRRPRDVTATWSVPDILSSFEHEEKAAELA